MPANDLECERAQVSAKRKKRVLRPTVYKRAAAFKIYHFPLCDCLSWSDVTHRKPDCQGCRSLGTRGHMTTRPSGQSNAKYVADESSSRAPLADGIRVRTARSRSFRFPAPQVGSAGACAYYIHHSHGSAHLHDVHRIESPSCPCLSCLPDAELRDGGRAGSDPMLHRYPAYRRDRRSKSITDGCDAGPSRQIPKIGTVVRHIL